MHEVGIAQSILDISRRELESRRVTRSVEKVTLRVGRLKAIVADSLSFHFDVLKKEIPQFETAMLDIHEIPVKVFCTGCKNEWVVEEPLLFCENCKGPVTVLSGEELAIDAIDVAD